MKLHAGDTGIYIRILHTGALVHVFVDLQMIFFAVL